MGLNGHTQWSTSLRHHRIILAAAVLLAISISESWAAVAEEGRAEALSPVKSIFSFDAGYISDGGSANGTAAAFRTATFFGGSDFYWGFASMFGSFITTGQAIFESGAVFGYFACKREPLCHGRPR